MKAFHCVDPSSVNGYAIFSRDSAYFYLNTDVQFHPKVIKNITVVGYPFNFFGFTQPRLALKENVFLRQSFLGLNSQMLLSYVKVGIIGLGGGGSHVVQQLAHLGIINFNIFDADHIESSNHNRLIGGWFTDISLKVKKTLIASRLIKKINPTAKVNIITDRWQENPNSLKECDLVIGCVDSYNERDQLESILRRNLIPLIDIGMDVHKANLDDYSISGQVILSMPGGPCMRCMGFITEEKLSNEAKKYGEAGGRPQVVWPNGVLASTAVGILVDLVTGWSKIKHRIGFITYDGELGLLANSPRISYLPENCTHYKLENTGDQIFKKL
jgi:molybdopterin/thiamine biosynthesis adenylyltransferase